MISPEELYAQYMRSDKVVPIDKDTPPMADWNMQLAWSKEDMKRMGLANEGLRNDIPIESARIIGAASILGSSKERMVTFTTTTEGEYFIHVRRRALVGRAALQRGFGGENSLADRPFLKIDGRALTVCYRGLATKPTIAGKHMFLYDQLHVGGYARLTWPATEGQHTDNYRSPSEIASMQTVSEMPDWVERLLYPGRLYEP